MFVPRSPMLLLHGLLLLLPGFLLAADDLPQPIPLEKYGPLIQRSPFAPATAVPTPTPAGFGDRLFVSGVARIGENYFVSIYDQDKAETFSLGTGEEKRGLTLSSVQWADKVGDTKVTVKKGTEFAVLKFDQAKLSAPPPPPAAVGNPNNRARNGMFGRGLPQPGVNRPPMPFPQQRGGMGTPAPGNPPRFTQPGVQPQTPAAGATPQTRRRIQVIPAPR